MRRISKLTRHLVICVLVVFVSFAVGTGISYAQGKYPTREIELVLTFSPGGILDLAGRIYAEELSKVLKVPITPKNRPGATGTVGTSYVLQAKKDGYTILTNSGSVMVIAPYLLKGVPFVALRDFVPVALLCTAPSCFVVKHDSPIKSLEDLIDRAKKNPGKITYASSGPGSDTHLIAEMFQDYAKVKFSHVPYGGGAKAFAALLGGHVDFLSNNLASASPNLRAGKFHGLVVFADNRSSLFSDIPTASEKGYPQYFPGYWQGLFVTTGTPNSVIDVLVAASEKVIKSKEYKSRIEDLGASAEYIEPAEFKKIIQNDEKVIHEVIDKLGLKSK